MKTISEKEFLRKYDAGEAIPESDLLRYVWGAEEVSRGEDRRWSRTIQSRVKIEDRYFLIKWEQGLTEMQDDTCYCQPVEVRKVEYEVEVPEKVIPAHVDKVVEWVPVTEE